MKRNKYKIKKAEAGEKDEEGEKEARRKKRNPQAQIKRKRVTHKQLFCDI